MWIWKLTKVKVERWVHFRGSWHYCHPTIGCEWIQNHRVLPVTIAVLYFYITRKSTRKSSTKKQNQIMRSIHSSARFWKAINQLWALQVHLSLWSQEPVRQLCNTHHYRIDERTTAAIPELYPLSSDRSPDHCNKHNWAPTPESDALNFQSRHAEGILSHTTTPCHEQA